MKQRYNTANDIRAAIDWYKAKAQKLKDSAAALDMKADEFKLAGSEYKVDVDYHRSQADKKRKAANRIEDRQLAKLKNKLSEWMTEPFKEIITDGDRSIPVR